MNGTHEHTWKLAEDGYTRTWSTEILDDGTIVAGYGGSEDWSDDGDGKLYLECSFCLERRDVPGDAEIEWN